MEKVIIRTRDNKSWTKNQSKSGKPWACENETLEFLYSFVRLIKPENIIEIGTFEGASAIAMGKGLKENKVGKLMTCDIKNFGQEENVNKAGLERYVECFWSAIPITEDFIMSAKDSFDMAFVDGGHSFEAVIKDLHNCDKLVKDGGFILGHDVVAKDGVKKAVELFLRKNERYVGMVLPSFAGVFILKKRVKNYE